MTIGYTIEENKPYNFDLDFDNEGDDLKTALYISLFTNKREISPEFSNQNLPQNGWFGNLLMFSNEDFQQGSFLWTLKKAILDNETINLILSYVEDSINWLVDEDIIEDFEINIIDENGYIIDEDKIYSHVINKGFVPLQITLKPYLKNQVKFSINFKNNGGI
jgi:phage gp46-like protein